IPAGCPAFAHVAMRRPDSRQPAPPMAFLHAARRALLEGQGRLEGDNPAAAELEASGPMPAPMARRAGQYRAQLLLSAPRRAPLHAALAAVVPRIHALPEARRVRWSLDVDPVDLY